MSYLIQHMNHARKDVLHCVKIMTEVLRDSFSSRINYAFVKGSAIKNWETPIDYTPVLSDVDIHIMLKDDASLLGGEDGAFDLAMEVSQQYEDRFRKNYSNPLHMPRTQIIHLNPFMKDPNYVPSRIADVQTIIGKPVQEEFPSKDRIREIDLDQLRILDEFVKYIPTAAVDRAGFDFWSLIRQMTWRVSPTPVRLLNQTYPNPIEAWSWNRTKIRKELLNEGYIDLANHYHGFYNSGWQLFLSNFTDLSEFRNVVKHGYKLLAGCLKAACKFSNQS